MSGIIEELNRVEKKMDRILELLEGKKLSITMNGKVVADTIFPFVTRQ